MIEWLWLPEMSLFTDLLMNAKCRVVHPRIELSFHGVLVRKSRQEMHVLCEVPDYVELSSPLF